MKRIPIIPRMTDINKLLDVDAENVTQFIRFFAEFNHELPEVLEEAAQLFITFTRMFSLKARDDDEQRVFNACGKSLNASNGEELWSIMHSPLSQDPKRAETILEAKAARGGDLSKVDTPKLHHILALNNAVAEGSIMVNCSWVYAGESPGRMGAHSHPYPEVIGFAGGDPRDADNLGAELEFWMEDEKYLIDKSCLIYVHAGMKHGPIETRNHTKDIFHFNIQLTRGEVQLAPKR